MFKIATVPRITRPVSLFVEVDGERQDHSFVVTFEVAGVAASKPEQITDEAGNRSLLEKVIVGLGDIVDSAGSPLPFTPELVATVLDRVDARGALTRAYYDVVHEVGVGN